MIFSRNQERGSIQFISAIIMMAGLAHFSYGAGLFPPQDMLASAIVKEDKKCPIRGEKCDCGCREGDACRCAPVPVTVPTIVHQPIYRYVVPQQPVFQIQPQPIFQPQPITYYQPMSFQPMSYSSFGGACAGGG